VTDRAVVDDTREVVRIAGEEAGCFLQGLLTVDVETVTPARTRYGALLTPQGKLFAELVIWRDETHTFLLDVPAERREALVQRLRVYRLRAHVEIEPDPSWKVVVIPQAAPDRFGLDKAPGAARAGPEGSRIAVDPRLAALGVRALVPLGREAEFRARFDLTEGEVADWRAHRLALGVPEGPGELEWERILALEANLAALGGVDFDKGCYVGQEVTARMRYRARPKKRLLPVRIGGETAVPVPVVDAGGREVGVLRAREGDRGLALLRIEPLSRPESHPLRAGSAVVTPFWPDWLEVEEKNPLHGAGDGV